jgi:hypothetical protein
MRNPPQWDLTPSVAERTRLSVEQIEQLELRIAELQEAIQRSWRLMLVGRACAIVGPALLLGFFLGLLTFTPIGMIIGIALSVGGLVLSGSSNATTAELELALKQTEKERSAEIDELQLVPLEK